MSKDIFISFASADRARAETVVKTLENRGFSCWICTRDIPPGGNYQEAISGAIRAAKVMVIVFSDNANRSDEVKKELSLAGKGRLAVIPLMIEDVVPGPAFDYEFSTRQWVRAFEKWNTGMTQLAEQAGRLVAVDTASSQIEPTITPVEVDHAGGLELPPLTAMKWTGVYIAVGVLFAFLPALVALKSSGLPVSVLMAALLVLRPRAQKEVGNLIVAGVVAISILGAVVAAMCRWNGVAIFVFGISQLTAWGLMTFMPMRESFRPLIANLLALTGAWLLLFVCLGVADVGAQQVFTASAITAFPIQAILYACGWYWFDYRTKTMKKGAGV